ncbi:putative disease resistance protein [Nymphaea thermarum]|nr:putative disease resistance protein [Nymphaea thermarum]
MDRKARIYTLRVLWNSRWKEGNNDSYLMYLYKLSLMVEHHNDDDHEVVGVGAQVGSSLNMFRVLIQGPSSSYRQGTWPISSSGQVQGLFLAVDCNVLDNEICKVASVEDELDNLKQKLELIQPFLRDAHNKQFASKEVKDWITRLNEVAYDAHDVIDLHQIQCRDVPTVPNPIKVRKLLTSLSSRQRYTQIARGIADKIKEINGRLDVLYKEKDLFGLALMPDEACPSEESSGFLREERQTTSAITEPSMIGREEDEELVVKWLVQEPNPRENEEGASVIAITGMGGIGKTALAKKIYNNGSIRDCFEKRMWVCVSERPNPLDLFRKTLEEVGGKDDGFNQLIGLNALHSEISNHLKDRKFLLVLDDVWEFGWWQELGSLWKGGTSGSKVMITTRKTKVEGLDFTHLHQLTFLTEKQSWQLFVDRALRRGEVEQDLDGTKILELPESITKLYDLQTLDLTNSDVQRLPDRISSLGALRHLDLRGTFLLKYLPKGIGKLTCLRTLNKFVVGSNLGDGRGSKLWELHDLNSLRGHLTIEHLERVDNIEEAKQAQLSRKENLQSLMLVSESTSSPEKVELLYEELQPPEGLIELSIICYAGVNFPTWMSSKIYYCLEEITFCDCKFLESLPCLGHLPNLLRLEISGAERVKDFDVTSNHVGGRAVFPKLEKLKLIDMLSLEEFLFDAERLSIQNCYRACLMLDSTFKMEKLKHLEIINSPKLAPLLEGVQDMKELKSLVVCGMSKLQQLLNKSPLDLYKLESVRIEDCHKLVSLPHGLHLNRLKKLALKDLPQLTSLPSMLLDNMKALEVLELGPNIHFRKGHGLLQNLNFSRLRCLKIFGFHELGTEWLRSKMKNMDQLEELVIEDSPKLVSISDVLKHHSLPKLRIINIACLSSYRVHTRQWRRSLTCSLAMNSFRLDALIINLFLGLDALPDWIQQLDQLEYLVIGDSENLTHLPNWLSKLSKLKRFRLTRLPELSSLPDAVGSLHQLEGLYIHSCPQLNFLPNGVQHLSRLHYLYISDCNALVERCQKEDGHKISHIPDLFLV